MKVKEIREKSKEEVRRLLDEKKELARKRRFDIASKQFKDHREYRKARKDIARLLTILSEKERQA